MVAVTPRQVTSCANADGITSIPPVTIAAGKAHVIVNITTQSRKTVFVVPLGITVIFYPL
jgi:hypothetical protein